MIATQTVRLTEKGTVQYPELLARQVEMAIQACKARVIENGGTLGRVEDGEIVPGEFIEVMFVVETRFLTDEEDINE